MKHVAVSPYTLTTGHSPDAPQSNAYMLAICMQVRITPIPPLHLIPYQGEVQSIDLLGEELTIEP